MEALNHTLDGALALLEPHVRTPVAAARAACENGARRAQGCALVEAAAENGAGDARWQPRWQWAAVRAAAPAVVERSLRRVVRAAEAEAEARQRRRAVHLGWHGVGAASG